MSQDNNEAASAPDLHSAIMNLPCDHRQHAEYKRGHRDARHAAAELVAAAEATSAPVPATTPAEQPQGDVMRGKSGAYSTAFDDQYAEDPTGAANTDKGGA